MTVTGTRDVHSLRGHKIMVGACAYATRNQAKVTSAVSEYTARKPRSPSWSRNDPRKLVLDSRTWLPQKAMPAKTSDNKPSIMAIAVLRSGQAGDLRGDLVD